MSFQNNVSIVMTVKNEEENISMILDSFLKQTYKFHEIVINDNGSDDRTINVIKEYQKIDARIKLVESKSQSIGRGRNTAIKHSSGDILAIMDAGIYPQKDWLEKVVSPLLKNSDLDIVWGNIVFDTKSRIIPSTSLSMGLVFLTKYSEASRKGKNVPSTAFRRKVWENMNGFPEIDVPIEDLLLISKVSKKGLKVMKVHDAIAYYFKYPTTYNEVFNKWMVSSFSAFIIKKSERGFFGQLYRFSFSFLFCTSLIFIDIRLVVVAILFLIGFFMNKYKKNSELGKKIIQHPNLLITSINLFFILNLARFIGIVKALKFKLSGKTIHFEL